MHVIVVGAGVVGCAVAYELAARGARVDLLDPRGSGQGATRASAGMLAPYIEGHSAALLQLGICGLDQYDAFLRRVAADARRPIEHRRTGTLQIARTDEDVRQLVRQQQTLAGLGTRADVLDGGDARRLEPALAGDIRGALRVAAHGYVRVPAFMDGLVAAAAARGARLSAVPVRRIGAVDGGIVVDAGDGAMSADAVVLAAGSWSGGVALTSGPPAPVRPVRGQIVQLRLGAPPVSHIIWGGDCYLVPWKDGRVLVGATVEEVGFDERVTDEAIHALRASGERLVPALGGAAFEEARAGLRPATSDELPIIGASTTMRGVFYATGHYRNGVLLAPLTAMLIADLVLGGRERPELDLVRPDRFGL